MPNRKKILTTSTEDLPPRSVRKLRQIKTEVAAEAARIMATEGQHNFYAAKNKAAERLGICTKLALPSNVEVEQALRSYLALYGGEAHSVRLQELREAACEAMQSLEPFSPRLVGPVLEGTADRHSRISLQVFSDPPDQVAMHLMEQGKVFHHETKKIRWHGGDHREIPVLVTESGEETLELTLFREIDLRQSPPSPVDGKPQRRASLAEVEMLVAGLESDSEAMFSY